VYSGYAPLSVRICQYAAKQSWKSLNDIAEFLPGEKVFFEENQKLPQGLKKKS
jgi:hypothetical protein